MEKFEFAKNTLLIMKGYQPKVDDFVFKDYHVDPDPCMGGYTVRETGRGNSSNSGPEPDGGCGSLCCGLICCCGGGQLFCTTIFPWATDLLCGCRCDPCYYCA